MFYSDNEIIRNGSEPRNKKKIKLNNEYKYYSGKAGYPRNYPQR